MDINQELTALEDHIGEEVDQWQELLSKVGIECKSVNDDLRMICPHCSTNRYSLSLKIGQKRYENYKWKCFNCNCNRKFYDSIVGLVRCFNPHLSPREALNLLIDAAYRPRGAMPKIQLPKGDYKNKPLSEVPYSYLKWIAQDHSAPFSEELRDQITDYLYDPLSPRKKVKAEADTENNLLIIPF